VKGWLKEATREAKTRPPVVGRQKEVNEKNSSREKAGAIWLQKREGWSAENWTEKPLRGVAAPRIRRFGWGSNWHDPETNRVAESVQPARPRAKNS